MHQLVAPSVQKKDLHVQQTKEVLLHPFRSIVQDIADGAVTSQTLLKLEEIHNTLSNDPQTLQYIFSEALQWQLGCYASAKVDDNLYLAKSDVAQIDLFKLLIEELPHVAFAQNIVNDIIVDVCSSHQHVTLVDIGIGTAQQCCTIIRKLAQTSSVLNEITIVGIEPSAESLVAAKQQLQSMQEETGICLNFHPINHCVEDIPVSSWHKLAAQYHNQNVVVNASFALHHLKDNQYHSNIRESIFRFIYAFQPIAFLLSEPNSDHLNRNFEKRFENCWHHFSLVFQLINELRISDNEKSALKLFFGREIKDIIGNSDALRSERHELATTWVDRLQKADFQLQSDLSSDFSSSSDFITIKTTQEKFHSFEYQQESLVAVMYAKPNQAA
jgi:GRAS domain family